MICDWLISYSYNVLVRMDMKLFSFSITQWPSFSFYEYSLCVEQIVSMWVQKKCVKDSTIYLIILLIKNSDYGFLFYYNLYFCIRISDTRKTEKPFAILARIVLVSSDLCINWCGRNFWKISVFWKIHYYACIFIAQSHGPN